MKTYSTPTPVIIIVLVVLFSMGPISIFAQQKSDVMHPKISLLDKEGNVITEEGSIIDTERTCGQCHDTQYINGHNNHFTGSVKADCIVCHFEESRMAGDFTAANLRIRLPRKENCAQCHGLVETGAELLFIPGDYEYSLDYREGERYYDITAHTGVIMGAKDLANSALNLKNKKNLHFPWDVHLRRELECISCHVIGNDPRYCGKINASLDHLLMDPRKVKSPGEILKRPDHNLKTASCTCCHDPFKVHDNLPYKKRHMDALSCQSCHVPEVYGPALQAVDGTVVKADGSPRVEYRGVDDSKSHGTALSTKYFEGYRPFLLPHQVQPVNGQKNGDEKEIQIPVYKISPFNLVTRWSWKSAATREPVPETLIRQVYLEESSASGYASDILKVFDKDQNQHLDDHELVLDEADKFNLVKGKLQSLGVEDPVITGTIDAYQVNHGVMEGLHMKRDCSGCHASASKLGQEVVLAGIAPSGMLPEFSPNLLTLINGNIEKDERGRIVLLQQNADLTGRYVFGHSRIRLVDRVGLWIFLLALLGIVLHGTLRYVFTLKHPPHRPPTRRVYMYRFYERLWHWTQAGGIMILALTGLEIHYTGSFVLFGLEYAVAIHNVLAFILVINAFLSLFYHLTTGEIKKFFGFNRKFIHEMVVQAYFYLHGIFKGTPHPINKTEERRLNPLQQLTYVGLLNILLPFQVITGILIWGADKWPFLSEKLGGLSFLAPLHNLGSWLFLAFLAGHIYLTTTGHTVFSNIRAMINGYDEVSEQEPHEEHRQLMEMELMDMVGTIIKKFIKKEKPLGSGGNQ